MKTIAQIFAKSPVFIGKLLTSYSHPFKLSQQPKQYKNGFSKQLIISLLSAIVFLSIPISSYAVNNECGVDYNSYQNKYGGSRNFSSNDKSFVALKADGSITSWGYFSGGAPSDSGYVSITSRANGFAAMKADGSITSWGGSTLFGDANTPPIETGYTSIASTLSAFAAMKADGSITSWGGGFGSCLACGDDDTPNDSGYISITSTLSAFAAMKADGSITAWGHSDNGGSNAPTDLGYVAIASTFSAFAAMKADGSITAWGASEYGGSGAPTDAGYVSIASSGYAFSAMKTNGSIVSWGASKYGGSGAPTDAGYVSIASTDGAFAAMKTDGSIIAWGNSDFGGIAAPSNAGYVSVASTRVVFAAMKADGSIVAWGGYSNNGSNGAPIDAGYVSIISTYYAFSAMKADGSITSWGDNDWGGSGAPKDSGYTSIASTGGAFAAMKTDGSITAWGNSIRGGSDAPIDSGYVSINGVGPNTPKDCSFKIDSNLDSDSDGLPDWYEDQYGLDKNEPIDALLDIDGDGLTNKQEFLLTTDPTDPSTQSGFLNAAPTNLLNFGSVVVGETSANQNISVSNTGNALLNGNCTITSPFNLAYDTCTFDLVPYEFMDVPLNFTPTIEGQVTGTISFTSNGGNVSLGITGSGTPIPTLLLPDSLLLEFFARQVAYGYEPRLANEGRTLPSGHFAAGWTLEKEFLAYGDLFRAVALTKPGFFPVLAIRGTGTNIPDWLENTSIQGVGFEEFEDAWANTGIKQWLIKNPHASITGHSQGGAQAQLLAYRAAGEILQPNTITLGQLITFNSAGINKTNIDLSEVISPANVKHFISAGDIVSQVGLHFVPGEAGKDIIYYDLGYPESLIGHLGFALTAHTGHWAQQELYDAEFLRQDNENLPEQQSVRLLPKNLLSYNDFISADFSHLNVSDPDDIINYADLDYNKFKEDVLTLFAYFPSIREYSGLELIRIAEILSSRAGSESGRTADLPRVLNLVYEFSKFQIDARNLVLGMERDVLFNITGELFSLSIDLGHTVGDGPRDYATFMLTTAYDLTSATGEGILDLTKLFGSSTINIGNFFLDGAEEGVKRFTETSKDFASWVFSAITPNTPVRIVEGANTESTPAIIVDRELGDSTMTSASGNSIFILNEGNETVILSGGNNVVFGFPAAMDQTHVQYFSITDALFLGDVTLEQSDLAVRKGSAILSLDTDDDNQADVEITLEGNFSIDNFVVEASSSGTYIRYLGDVSQPVVPGDLDGDNDIDRDDYNLFRTTLGKCEGDASFIPSADYDGDACITYGDYSIWLGYYRK